MDGTKLAIGGFNTASYLGGGMTSQGLNNNIALAVYWRTAATVSATANGSSIYYVNDTTPIAWNTDGEMSIQFTVPIAGWGVTD